MVNIHRLSCGYYGLGRLRITQLQSDEKNTLKGSWIIYNPITFQYLDGFSGYREAREEALKYKVDYFEDSPVFADRESIGTIHRTRKNWSFSGE
jgi:hypothetical protein